MKKLIYVILAAALLLCLCVGAAAEELPVLIDESALLTQQEAADLTAKLERIREEQGIDIVVLTTDSLDGKSAMAYADDYYDDNGYGDDGVLLLVSMGEREWWISTCGSCMYAIDADYLGQRFVSYLSDGRYYDAFYAFALGCEAAMEYDSYQDSNYDDGVYWEPEYDSYEPEYVEVEKDPVKTVLICFVIGAVVGLIVVLIMKGQLKTVRRQSDADRYINGQGLNLRVQTDRFLYQNVSRRAKPQENTSSRGGGGRGGGFHVSSSGRSHGGGGGKF